MQTMSVAQSMGLGNVVYKDGWEHYFLQQCKETDLTMDESDYISQDISICIRDIYHKM